MPSPSAWGWPAGTGRRPFHFSLPFTLCAGPDPRDGRPCFRHVCGQDKQAGFSFPELRQSHCSRQFPWEAENTEITAPRRATCTASNHVPKAKSELLQKSPCTEALFTEDLRETGFPPDVRRQTGHSAHPGTICARKVHSLKECAGSFLIKAISLHFIHHI